MADFEWQGDDYGRVRVEQGWISVRRDDAGIWRVSWEPDEGNPDWPGRTYSPGDADLPGDYPGADDPNALLEWGRQRWGGR